MKKPLLTLLLLSGLIMNSCNLFNNEFEGVQGHVFDATTGQPLAGARVWLLETSNEWGIFGGGSSYWPIDSTLTDAQGAYSFTFENNSETSNAVYAIQEAYIVGNDYLGVLYGDTEADLYLTPQAWLKVHIQSIAEYGSISINGLFDDPYYGNVDTTEIISVDGNSFKQLYYFVYDGGGLLFQDQVEIYCPPFDTTYYELLY